MNQERADLAIGGAPSTRRSRACLQALWDALPPQVDRRGDFFEISLGRFSRCQSTYEFKKLVFIGPTGGDGWLRIGLFAGIHGDEPAGSAALIELVRELEEDPALARGLELHLYPVCNPSGYEDHTRWPRGGPDLNREFWSNSQEPEVRILQEQLRSLRFDGLVALHSDDTCDGIYGYAGGDILNRNLLLPALSAAGKILPCCMQEVINGWTARNGLIEDSYPGVLSAPPEQSPRPFEVIFETPGRADHSLQQAAFRAALLAIFDAATALRAHGANI